MLSQYDEWPEGKKTKLKNVLDYLNRACEIRVLVIGERGSVVLDDTNVAIYGEYYVDCGSIVCVNDMFHITVIKE